MAGERNLTQSYSLTINSNMAKFKEPVRQSDFMSGMVSDVSKNIIPENSVALAVNLDFDETLGAAVVRPGSTLIGSQLVSGKTILGLHQHNDPKNASNNILLAVVNVISDATSTIKNVATGVDVSIGLTADEKVRFLSFGGETVAINGVMAPQAWDNTNWITTAGVFDLGDWPAAESSLVTEFLDRIYTNDETVPYRVNYSGLFNGTAIAWEGDYIDIEPEDGGGKITAFGKVPGYILFFKERSLHRWNYNSAFPESLVQVGTPTQESVVESGGLVFFYSNSSDDARGFYVTNGGRPQSISQDTSRTVNKFVQAIDPANESNIAAFATDRTIGWSVGDLEVEGETYKNVVFRYNRVLNQWSIRTYPTEFKVFSQNIDSGVGHQVGGDDDGNVIKIDDRAAYTDFGSAINYQLRTHSNKYGRNTLKTMTDEFFVEGKHLNGLGARVIPNEDPSAAVNMTKLSRVNPMLVRVAISEKVIGTSLAVELWGTADGNRPEISEIELTSIDVKETYEQ